MNSTTTRMTVTPHIPENRLNAVDLAVLPAWFESVTAGPREGRQALRTAGLDDLVDSADVALPDDQDARDDIQMTIFNRYGNGENAAGVGRYLEGAPEWMEKLYQAAGDPATTDVTLPVGLTDYLQDLMSRPNQSEWWPIDPNELEVRVEDKAGDVLGQWMVRPDSVETVVERAPDEAMEVRP